MNLDIKISLKCFFTSDESFIFSFSTISLNFEIISFVVSTPASAVISIFSKLAKNSSLIDDLLNNEDRENFDFEVVKDT